MWTKFEILTPYISWDTVHFVGILTIYPKIASALVWLLYGLYYGEKQILRKLIQRSFVDAFMMIWVWKSGFNSWNQSFQKCTLFAWSTVNFSTLRILNPNDCLWIAYNAQLLILLCPPHYFIHYSRVYCNRAIRVIHVQ